MGIAMVQCPNLRTIRCPSCDKGAYFSDETTFAGLKQNA